MQRRLGAPQDTILIAQHNLACTYSSLGRKEEALRLRRDVYSGCLKFKGDEHYETLIAANNYALSLMGLQRFKEAKSLLRRTLPVTRRVLGESDETTLRTQLNYADTLWGNRGATLDNLREAVKKLEETERTARRVMGGAHPLTARIENHLRMARAALCAREASTGSA